MSRGIKEQTHRFYTTSHELKIVNATLTGQYLQSPTRMINDNSVSSAVPMELEYTEVK